MGLKERMAMKAAERLIGKVNKEDFLEQLRAEIEKQGILGQEGAVDAAIERIEKSGLKKIFDQLGVTREDLKEAFKDEEKSRQESKEGTHEGKGGPQQEINPQDEVANGHGPTEG